MVNAARTGAAALLLLFLAVDRPAQAQQPTRFSLSSGYQDMVYTIGQSDDPLPPGYEWYCPGGGDNCQFFSASYSVHGLYFDAARQISPKIALVGEWQWNRTGNAGLFGGDPDEVFPGLRVSVHQFAGGLRFPLLPHPRFEPFAQVLVGGARVSARAPGISETETAADLRIGGGIDVMFSSAFGLRGSGSYTHLFTSDVERNDVAQFGLGIVFKR
jgi:hypothetical protein